MNKFIIKFGEFVSIVCLVAFIMFINAEDKVTEKSAEELGISVISSINVDGLTMQDMNGLKKQFGISDKQIDSFIYYKSDDVMDVREVLIVKVADNTSGQSIFSSVEKVLSDKKTLFESYAPEQSALLNKAVLVYENNIVFYAVGEDATIAYESLLESL